MIGAAQLETREPGAGATRVGPRRWALPVGAAGLAAFSSVAVGAGLGRALLTTYLPVLLERIDNAPGLIGTVMLVNTFAGFVVPLVVGVWSDRLRDRGHGRTLPFVLGGTLLAAGGLVAVALGHATSYLALALFAAVAYFGLNAVTTAHRALIAEDFDRDERAAATGWEEVALLIGTLLGVVAGGVLIELGGAAPFLAGAVLLPLLAVPTVRRMRGRERPWQPRPAAPRGARYYLRAARRPGARLLLAAQGLWVLAYVGLAPFFVIYADHVLGLRPGPAALLLAGFGIASGVTMLVAGNAPEGRQRSLLLVGAAAMGLGLLAVATASSVAPVAIALLPAAIGFGLLTTLGFPAYSAFIPRGDEGAYSALYFSVRSVASAIAVPVAGWSIAITDSYRTIFVFGGCAALAALLPLSALGSESGGRGSSLPRRIGAGGWLPRGSGGRIAGYLGFLMLATLVVLGAGLVVDRTALLEADKEFFLLLNGVGWHPSLVDRILVDPHIQNYFLLTVLAGVAAHYMRRDGAWRTAAIVAGSGLLAYATVRFCWALWDRPRPEEVLGILPANGHEWTDYPSFPSGHVAVTTAMVAAAAALLPKLRWPLWAYAAIIAVTRVSFGAHFPADVIAGVVLGFLAGRLVLALAMAEMRPHRLALGELLVSGSGRLRALARATSLAALLAFVFFALTEGPPLSPDGGVLGAGLERDLQIGLLVATAVCVAAAWWRDAFGLALLVAGMGLGAFAALQYTPVFAVLACLAFALPALFFLLAWRRVRTLRSLAVVGAGVVAIFTLGAFAALNLHDRAYGPATPQSSLPTPPTWRVNWAWAGAVTGRGVTVKARLNSDARVRLLVGPTPDLRGARASAVRFAEGDNDRIVAFRMAGLEPDRRYFYGFEVDGRLDPYRVGKFRTFPLGRSSFEIAFAGCARVGSNAAVFDAIRREHPLLFLSLGDFFYANIEENAPGLFLDQYDRALTTPAQGALYRSTAVAYVWDDHDFAGDGSDSSGEAAPAAQQMYRRAVPRYPLRAGPEGAIAQAFTIGRVRFILTDGRSQRTDESMLGAAQLRWLKRQLLATRGRDALTVLFTSVPWIAPAEAGADDWAGYAAERAEISRFIARHGLGKRIVMLAGDAHMLAIDDGSNTDYSGSGRAGFPLIHAGPLDRPAHAKGGPYSEGVVTVPGQYGTMSVRDEGGPVRVELAGRDRRGREVIGYSFSVPPLP